MESLCITACIVRDVFLVAAESDIRPLCGNGRIEKGEECDVGFTEDNVEDACCDKNCHLKTGAECRYHSVCECVRVHVCVGVCVCLSMLCI